MWSYSTLKDVETCPRRYALARAEYPGLWSKRGYPRRPNPAAIKGDVVHGALEVIVKAMSQANCPSPHSEEAVGVLRALGGFTAVAKEQLDRQLARYDGNPRVSDDRRQQLRHTLSDWLPTAREQIQVYLTRLRLNGSTSAGVSRSSAEPLPRRPVGPGDHPEKELIAEHLRLRGHIDLLSVSDSEVAVFDFKTGAEDPSHQEQLRMYALLWSEDGVANPNDRPVTSLSLEYPTRDISVDVPSAEELARLAKAVSARVATADAETAAAEPEARVGEQCDTCFVRGLCGPYWAHRAAKAGDVADGAWFDLQGTVVRAHGVKSFVLQETRGGATVLVRTPMPGFDLPIGKRVRILGARRTVDPDDGESLIASLSHAAEVYRVED